MVKLAPSASAAQVLGFRSINGDVPYEKLKSEHVDRMEAQQKSW